MSKGPTLIIHYSVGLLVLSLGLSVVARAELFQSPDALTAAERREAIRRASVWAPTDIAAVDFKTGPEATGAFAYNEWVTCTYSQKQLGGKSPKFACETSPGQEIKVKYGPRNAEVFGEVLATRLFWALGFPVDRMYPVRVRCLGCPPDPQKDAKPGPGVTEFDPAAIERKLPGRAMETSSDSGWDWAELEDIGPDAPPGAAAQRDALRLLAAFVQHTDSNAANQRLLCPTGEEIGSTGCRSPVLMVSDLGLTFGRSGFLILDKNKNSVSLADWIDKPVWKDEALCVAQLSQSFRGTLNNPTISEAGRKFLADLLIQLSDTQLRDLFETARVHLRSSDPSSKAGKDARPASVDIWVEVFKLRRAQIVGRVCPIR